MKVDYENALVEKSFFQKKSVELKPYLNVLKNASETREYKFNESSLKLPFEKKFHEESKKLAAKKSNKNLKYIILIGIGGSNLGTKPVYDALFGFFDLLEPKRFPKIIFLDTVNSTFSQKLRNFIKSAVVSPDEIIINIITKSGSTIETIANAEAVIS